MKPYLTLKSMVCTRAFSFFFIGIYFYALACLKGRRWKFGCETARTFLISRLNFRTTNSKSFPISASLARHILYPMITERSLSYSNSMMLISANQTKVWRLWLTLLKYWPMRIFTSHSRTFRASRVPVIPFPSKRLPRRLFKRNPRRYL